MSAMGSGSPLPRGRIPAGYRSVVQEKLKERSAGKPPPRGRRPDRRCRQRALSVEPAFGARGWNWAWTLRRRLSSTRV